MKRHSVRRALFASLTLPALPTTHAQDIKVLSFNLRYITREDRGPRTWENRRDHAADIIFRENADFTGVQEAFRPMLDDIKTRVPGLGEIGVGREDGKQRGEYSAILYREALWQVEDSGTFWLSDTPEIPGSTSWGNRVTRICTWGRFRHRASGLIIHVFNAHLDHESQPAREKSTTTLIQHIAPLANQPVILTGDFNATPDNPAIATLSNSSPALIDAWQHCNPHAPPAESGTVHGFSARPNGPRIDYIFCSTHLTPSKANILRDTRNNQTPSDHFPVSATLNIQKHN